MGFGGISIWQLLIVLAIVVLLFGTKKLRNMGGDIGAAIKNFKSSMRDAQDKAERKAEEAEPKIEDASGRVFDAEVDSKDKDEVDSKDKDKV